MLDKLTKLKKLNILFVEDEKDIRDNISKTFTKLQVHFDTAENGVIALEKINDNHYDLIVIDINMPIMNGLELLKIIREELKMIIPIYIMTAHRNKEYTSKAVQLGVENYIIKPFDIIKFINMTYNTEFSHIN